MKRTILAIVGILLVSTIMIGCKKGGAGGSGSYPVEISVYAEDPFPQPNDNNKMYAYIKEKLNVTFTFDILVGDAAQKRGTMVAGGVYPDLLQIRETTLIDNGAAIPLEDLIEKYGPNIKKHYADVWEKMKSSDGHIYYLIDFGVNHGRDWSPDYNQTAFWVQKDVLRDAGYPKIATIDQFFDMIANYQKKNPTINGQQTIPFSVLTHDWRIFELWNPPNFLSGHPNEGNGIVDPVTHEYKNFFTMDVSKRWFKFLNEQNSKGLVDRSSFTDNYDQFIAKLSTGRVLGMSIQGWQFMYTVHDPLREAGQYWRTFAPLPVVFDESIRPRYRNLPIPNLGRGIAISKSAKDPVRIIRMLNQWLSEDVQRTLQWGIEGEDWQYDSNKVPYRTPEQRANWQDSNWRELNRARIVTDLFPKNQGSFSDGNPTDLSNLFSEREAMLRDEDKQIWAAYGVGSWNELMDKDPPPNALWFPTWSMENPPDGSPAQIALQRCENTMRQRLPQMILAPPAQFETMWASYVQEMNNNGIATYEAYMQEKLNQRIKEWSK
jgi:putative aldouronate transport system substrate-binding protein